jgi:hypothetical protein
MVLIVDIRSFTNGALIEGTRGYLIRAALEAQGIDCVISPHVDPNGPTADTWETVKSRTTTFLQSVKVDCVLLHVGDIQPNVTGFLEQCCQKIPVLGYSGAPPSDSVRASFRRSPFHALDQRIVDSPPSSEQLERFVQWVCVIRDAQGDQRAIQEAGDVVRAYDGALESELKMLMRAVEDGHTYEQLLAARKNCKLLGE